MELGSYLDLPECTVKPIPSAHYPQGCPLPCLPGLVCRAFGSEAMWPVLPSLLSSSLQVTKDYWLLLEGLSCVWGLYIFPQGKIMSGCSRFLHAAPVCTEVLGRVSPRLRHGDSALVWFLGWMQIFLSSNNSNIVSKGI